MSLLLSDFSFNAWLKPTWRSFNSLQHLHYKTGVFKKSHNISFSHVLPSLSVMHRCSLGTSKIRMTGLILFTLVIKCHYFSTWRSETRAHIPYTANLLRWRSRMIFERKILRKIFWTNQRTKSPMENQNQWRIGWIDPTKKHNKIYQISKIKMVRPCRKDAKG